MFLLRRTNTRKRTEKRNRTEIETSQKEHEKDRT